MANYKVVWHNWNAGTTASITNTDYTEETCTTSEATGTVWRYWTQSYNRETTNVDREEHQTVVWKVWTGDATNSTATNYHDNTQTWFTWTQSECGDNLEEPVNDAEACEAQGEARRAQGEEEINRREMVRVPVDVDQESYTKHIKKKEAAEAKAKELLLDLIGKDQLKVYEETGKLFVRGNKHDYIVQREGFIKQITKDKVLDICVHLKDKNKYPETDNVVALKLALEANEDEMLKMANVHKTKDRKVVQLPKAACM